MNQCPRTGQPCPLPKQFTVTEMTPQGARALQCCQQCALGQGLVALPVLQNPLAVLQQVMQQGLPGGIQVVPSAPQPKCSGCGATPSDIEQAGRFGCPKCYQSFHDDIETMLGRHHGGIRHVGKVPKAWLARQKAGEGHKTEVDRAIQTVKRHKAVPLDERIKLLKDKMQNLVKQERYEKAAVLRDVIKQFEASASATETTPSPSPSPETPSVSS